MLRLKEIRKKNGLSQQQLAQQLGVTQATLSGWENEKYEIDNTSLLKCSDIFNVSVDELLGKDPTPSLDEQLEGIEFALYGEVQELTDAQKQDILDYARFKKAQWEKENENK